MNRIRLRFALFLVNHLLSGTHFFSLKRILLNWTDYFHIGEDSKIVGPIHSNTSVNIGSQVWIGRNLSVEGNGMVEIGNNCDFAPNITIYTGFHEIGTTQRRAGIGRNGSVIIGDGTWVCGSSIILPNTEIGRGVIIAAGSVVNKNIKDDRMVGGCPAITIKELD